MNATRRRDAFLFVILVHGAGALRAPIVVFVHGALATALRVPTVLRTPMVARARVLRSPACMEGLDGFSALLDANVPDVSEVLDDDDLVCARGLCVRAEEEDTWTPVVVGPPPSPPKLLQYWWPRGLLLLCSVLYGTNFGLGRILQCNRHQ